MILLRVERNQFVRVATLLSRSIKQVMNENDNIYQSTNVQWEAWVFDWRLSIYLLGTVETRSTCRYHLLFQLSRVIFSKYLA